MIKTTIYIGEGERSVIKYVQCFSITSLGIKFRLLVLASAQGMCKLLRFQCWHQHNKCAIMLMTAMYIECHVPPTYMK